MGIFRKFKRGDYCIYDIDNVNANKGYRPIKVRIFKYGKNGYYLCVPIEPLVYPIKVDGYAAKLLYIPERLLTKIDEDKEIVVRFPTSMPSITEDDLNILKDIVNENNINKDRVMKLYYKLMYYAGFNS